MEGPDIPSARERLRALYEEWMLENARAAATWVNGGVIVVCVALIGACYLLYDAHHVLIDTPVYLSVIALAGISLWVVGRPERWPERWRGELFRAALLLPMLAVTTAYLFFSVMNGHAIYVDLLVANFCIIVFAGFALHRFWREHYLFHFGALAVWGLGAWAVADVRHMFGLVVLMHLGMFAVFYAFRRQFVGQMYERYLGLCQLVPERIAHHLTVRPGEAVEQVFPPRVRFTACLVCRWRNYHELVGAARFETVSKLTEVFYDLVLDEVGRLVPEGTCFVDWRGGELTIVFYAEDDHPDLMLDAALRTAEALVTRVVHDVMDQLGEPLVLDVGLAAGPGLLGMQGPKRQKKTAVTGEAPLLAKRLAREARRQREARSDGKDDPGVLMDETIYQRAVEHGIFSAGDVRKVRAEEAELRLVNAWLWRPQLSARPVDALRESA